MMIERYEVLIQIFPYSGNDQLLWVCLISFSCDREVFGNMCGVSNEVCFTLLSSVLIIYNLGTSRFCHWVSAGRPHGIEIKR
jgi:hypothetical protein